MSDDEMLSAEDAFMPKGGVIDTFLKEAGCVCRPHLVHRTTPPTPLPFEATMEDEDGNKVPVQLIAGPGHESVLAHDEDCPLWREDPWT